MKAIILPTGNPSDFDPISRRVPEYLFPFANKPIVEHLIELLFRNDIKDIILVLKHMPYETEQYFGNGERWGCNISYSLVGEYNGIGPTLGHIRSRLDDTFLCMPWNVITDMDISSFCTTHEQGPGGMTVPELQKRDNATNIKESYPFIMSPDTLSVLLTSSQIYGLGQIISLLSDRGLALNTYSSEFNFRTIHNLKDYFDANRFVLEGDFKGIIIPGKQARPDIRIGRHSRIHPNAKILSPTLIGSHCDIRNGVLIGENSTIGDNVIVDKGASINNSIIFNGTYIGPHTEIRDSIIRKNSMIHVPRLLNIHIEDDFILGDLDSNIIAKKGERLFNLTAALFLFLLFSPIIGFLYLYHFLSRSKRYLVSEERYGAYEVTDLQGNIKPRLFKFYFFRSRYRFISKLPGLINIINGDMNLVGNSPLTSDEASSLRDEWETIRFKAPAGLFHLWEGEYGPDPTWEEKIVIESYYASTRTFYGDLKILFKFFLRPRKIKTAVQRPA